LGQDRKKNRFSAFWQKNRAPLSELPAKERGFSMRGYKDGLKPDRQVKQLYSSTTVGSWPTAGRKIRRMSAVLIFRELVQMQG